jgi:glycosyltransferase involved in cell wall biosynthesis
MIPVLFSVGAFGCLALTILFPLLAYPGYYLQRRRSEAPIWTHAQSKKDSLRIDILIPAHNEAKRIDKTISSLQRSITTYREESLGNPAMDITIHVVADGCTDSTVACVRKRHEVYLMESPDKKGKWATIRRYLQATSADWIILVDAGTLWPEKFIAELSHRFEEESNAIALAPSYRPLTRRWIPQTLWLIETFLKRLEAHSGGPISLHGATIAYKTDPLRKALNYLGNQRWLNDDVVIPLIMRAMNPDASIIYPVGEIQDMGVETDQFDLGRRKRMLLGNLQWTRTLLPACMRMNPVAGMVAARRVFRMLWAYWLTCLLVGLVLAFHSLFLPILVLNVSLFALSGSFRQISGAAAISFLTPLLFLRSTGLREVAWV